MPRRRTIESMDTSELSDLDREHIAYFSAKIRADPGDLGSYAGRGLLYEDLGRNALAIADFTQVLVRDPNRPNLVYLHKRGRLYRLVGNYDAAITDFSNMTNGGPWLTGDALSERAYTYQLMGEFDLAEADYSTLIERDYRDADALLGRAEARLRNSLPEAALVDVDLACHLYAGSSDLHAEAMALRARIVRALPHAPKEPAVVHPARLPS
jgi:tetratricopeptide (TPR) repeat protein